MLSDLSGWLLHGRERWVKDCSQSCHIECDYGQIVGYSPAKSTHGKEELRGKPAPQGQGSTRPRHSQGLGQAPRRAMLSGAT